MLEGEERIRAIERSIGKQIVGLAWSKLIAKKQLTMPQISRADFNRTISNGVRLDRPMLKEVLDVLKTSGKVKTTRKRIKFF